ncbi:MAG: phosphate ABC transporter permease PstA [Thermoplasmata archaeon]
MGPNRDRSGTVHCHAHCEYRWQSIRRKASRTQGGGGRLKLEYSPKRAIKNFLAQLAAIICVILALIPLISILVDVLVKGLPQLSISFLTENIPPPGDSRGGIGPAIVGSIFVICIGSAIGIPLGMMSGIYVSEYGQNRFGRFVRFMTEVLSGFPSIVIGIFSYLLLVTLLKGTNAIAGGFALSIIMLPIVSRATEESLKLVPVSVREASLALGAPKWLTTLKVVLTHARAGIITGIVLSISRIAGESAPLLLTVGWTTFYPESLVEPVSTLPVLIYQFAISPYDNWQDLAWGASALLLMIILSLSIVVRYATRKRFSKSRRR